MDLVWKLFGMVRCVPRDSVNTIHVAAVRVHSCGYMHAVRVVLLHDATHVKLHTPLDFTRCVLALDRR